MKNKDLISIMIPCYNSERFIDKCLSNILNQTYKNIELVAVNDGSTDNTKSILEGYIEKFENKGMKLIIINQKNSGQAAAIDAALKKITGKYVMWQDSDDYLELDAVENLHTYLLNNPDEKMVRGEAAFRNDNDMSKILEVKKSKYPNQKNIFDFYVFETDSYCYSGIFMVRTDHLFKCLKNKNIYKSRAGQNWQLILPISYKENCGYLDKVVYNYRIVENSHSHSVRKTFDLLKRCDEHKDILFNVIDSIKNMSSKEKKYYKKRLEIKYLKKKIKIISKNIKDKLKKAGEF